MWNVISDEYKFDSQSRQYRLHVVMETDIAPSYISMPRASFDRNQVIPYFHENNMIYYSDFKKLVDKRIRKIEKNGSYGGCDRRAIERSSWENYNYVFYRLEKRYVADGKLMLEFSIFEPKF